MPPRQYEYPQYIVNILEKSPLGIDYKQEEATAP